MCTNDPIEDLHCVAGAALGEHLSQANRLLGFDIQRVVLDCFLEEAQQTSWHLSLVIHGDKGCGHMDEILHVSERLVGQPLLNTVEVGVQEDWQLEGEVFVAAWGAIVKGDYAANGGEALRTELVLLIEQRPFKFAQIGRHIHGALHLTGGEHQGKVH